MQVLKGIQIAAGFKKTESKLYLTIDLEKTIVGRTRLLERDHSNPRWYESFHIYCAHTASKVVFTIKVHNPIWTEQIGRAYIPVDELIHGEEVDKWLEILNDNNKPIHGHPKTHFYDVTRERCWSQGLKNHEFPGVPFTFFPQRKGCKVTLYQDAHVPDDFIPKIPLSGGKYYEPYRCWEDIFYAISNAKHLVYIAGWSVYIKIMLVRDERRLKPSGDMTLGELLKKKANEGVRVLMLVWDDQTSIKLLKLKEDGLMATHDKDTESYFHNTQVHCVLCPRNPDDGCSMLRHIEFDLMFTHHQKIVVRRRIVSFIGGIDLCDRRYDTQFHSLFRTLATTHHEDFHQANCMGATVKKGDLRKPWHDVHCKLEGPAAWDVLYNFEQRWRKQGGKDLLVPLQELKSIIIPPSSVMFPDDRETWNVQVFQYIDDGATSRFPESPEEAANSSRVSGEDSIIDRSIQDAYIHAIRRAKKFIYIENQYFLGSSFSWYSNDIEIVSKIEAGVQAILDWQKRTMEMMYMDIAKALKAKGIRANPKNYLTFFCLGNREMKKSGEYEPSQKQEPNTYYSRAQQSRRGMIYVHAKMKIVDDEYIIIGYANINQRSMDGGRDTEIAMGAYQPYHLSCKQPAKSQIHGFRMALWYEHMGLLDNDFCYPETLECNRKVNKIEKRNWEHYTHDVLESDLPSHLLSYQIAISSDGKVTEMPKMENFPDTTARVLGSVAEFYHTTLTT
ncbi:Phospholipase D1 [Handroanthus impetiginosus]|uniref:Phospholipase D n=1 Tax=Handroanthus impetiginosus TaxID=429701 RepID=A0A2G9GXI3_9LAMI|nr:Phospholipase D1 [Handroanthus impetiginosus]